MKKTLYLFSLLLSILVLGSCSGDDAVVPVGSVRGVVTNSKTGQPVPGCEVITSKNKTAITNAKGEFQLNDIVAGNETLSFKATGYVSQTTNVTVESGRTASVNIELVPHVITYSIYPVDPLLDFGVNTSVMNLTLRNPTSAPMEYKLTSNASWITMEPSSGLIPADKDENVKVTINRNSLSEGNYEQVITLVTPGGAENNMNIKVMVDQGAGIRPSVNTLSAVQDNGKNAIQAKGSVVNMGSTRISSYGFVYSVEMVPTLENCAGKIDLGALPGTTDFSYLFTNLEFEKEYYVRAYATNEAGTSYGETINLTLHKPGIQQMLTDQATAVKITTADLHGSIKVYLGADVNEVGFYYGTTPTPSLKNIVNSYPNGTTIQSRNVESSLEGLQPGTKYYYQTYAQCVDGSVEKGNVMSFTTMEYPTFTFNKIECEKINVRYYHLEFDATIDPKGNTIVEAGFLWNSTNAMLTMDNPRHKVVCQINNNKISYNDDINNLDIHLYVRGYLIMSDGTVVYSGEPLCFDEF